MRLMPGLLRLKIYLATDGRRIAVALLLVATAAFVGAGMAYVDPPTTTVTEDRHEQTVATNLTTSAVVTGDTELYEQGRRLSEMPLYLRSVAPRLTLRLRTSVPNEPSVRVTQRLWVTYTASRDGKVFWQERRSLETTRTRVTDGTATVETRLRIAEVADRLATLREEVAGVAGLTVRLHASVEYNTGRYRGNVSSQAPLVVSEQAYWLGGDIAAKRSHSTTHRIQRVDQSKALTVALPIQGQTVVPHVAVLLAVVGMAGLAGAVWTRAMARRDVDVDRLRKRLHERRYREWISEGHVPSGVGERRVRMRSLQALVDVAIDSSKRVVHDPENGTYVVVDGDVVYYYSPLDGDDLGPFTPKEPVDERPE